MKIAVLTLGCKVNQSESAVIEGSLRKNGHILVKLSEHPDICIINTCTVTAKSDYQSRQLIRRALRAGGNVYVTGCYAEMNRDHILQISETIQVFNNKNKYHIINAIESNSEGYTFSYSPRARPYVKIQDGCNMACSYCIVPKARGRSQSVPSREVLERILCFEQEGYPEVILTGIHIGSYGYDLKPKASLAELLRMVLKKTRISRIRISSLEAYEISDELLEIFCNNRICRHIHLPLQSGDDSILKMMKRRYSTREYRNVVEKISDLLPGIALGTDIITGFPGEGDVEFENTIKFIEQLPFSYVHIFPFSSRPSTQAAQMQGRVAHHRIKERCTALDHLNRAIKMRYAESHIGKRLDMVVEEHDIAGTATGTSSNYLKIKIPSNTCPVKSLVSVGVQGREEDYLIGNPLQG